MLEEWVCYPQNNYEEQTASLQWICVIHLCLIIARTRTNNYIFLIGHKFEMCPLTP